MEVVSGRSNAETQKSLKTFLCRESIYQKSQIMEGKKVTMKDEEKMASIKSAVDFSIMGDNISDIAAFTIEKYEFKNDTNLSSDVRQAGEDKIKEALWDRVEALKKRRMQILAQMFTLAETTLDEVINKGK